MPSVRDALELQRIYPRHPRDGAGVPQRYRKGSGTVRGGFAAGRPHQHSRCGTRWRWRPPGHNTICGMECRSAAAGGVLKFEATPLCGRPGRAFVRTGLRTRWCVPGPAQWPTGRRYRSGVEGCPAPPVTAPATAPVTPVTPVTANQREAARHQRLGRPSPQF